MESLMKSLSPEKRKQFIQLIAILDVLVSLTGLGFAGYLSVRAIKADEGHQHSSHESMLFLLALLTAISGNAAHCSFSMFPFQIKSLSRFINFKAIACVFSLIEMALSIATEILSDMPEVKSVAGLGVAQSTYHLFSNSVMVKLTSSLSEESSEMQALLKELDAAF